MKDLFICSCNGLRQTKNARTEVQPHTPQLSKTQSCGMLPRKGLVKVSETQVAGVRVASYNGWMYLEQQSDMVSPSH